MIWVLQLVPRSIQKGLTLMCGRSEYMSSPAVPGSTAESHLTDWDSLYFQASGI